VRRVPRTKEKKTAELKAATKKKKGLAKEHGHRGVNPEEDQDKSEAINLWM